MIAIIDYDAGNTCSVMNALKRLNLPYELTDDAGKIESAEKVIFPGVGHAQMAMETLKRKHLVSVIQSLQQPVLGICLGAQLIADVLGANITRNKHKEIGWFPVRLTEQGQRSSLLASLPSPFFAFHWHEDTFSIPSECARIATNDACPNQGFQHKDRVLGLQFHLEATAESIDRLIKNCKDEIVQAKFVQDEPILRAKSNLIPQINRYMDTMLDQLEIIHERRQIAKS